MFLEHLFPKDIPGGLLLYVNSFFSWTARPYNSLPVVCLFWLMMLIALNLKLIDISNLWDLSNQLSYMILSFVFLVSLYLIKAVYPWFEWIPIIKKKNSQPEVLCKRAATKTFEHVRHYFFNKVAGCWHVIIFEKHSVTDPFLRPSQKQNNCRTTAVCTWTK